mmetsp:Transcript_2120/g.5258  ORF Transcript_2120/g.5258 Transcript_2120/m.5258 type:complete len:207 (+) Transcript_2120:80-700(+)
MSLWFPMASSPHHGSGGIMTPSNVKTPMAPSGGIGLQLVTSWNAEEHQEFVDALEATSRIHPEMTPTQTWQYLADAVPSKTLQEVKRHALLYLHKLNMESEERMRTSSSADTVVASDEATPHTKDAPQRKPVQQEPVKGSGASSSQGSNGSSRKRKASSTRKTDEWSPAEELLFEKLLLQVRARLKWGVHVVGEGGQRNWQERLTQ